MVVQMAATMTGIGASPQMALRIRVAAKMAAFT
jgi:hypothetical protein